MPELFKKRKFEPSSASKKKWLFTRKVKNDQGLPGLFSTSDFNLDIMMFLAVLVLEALGLLFLQIEGGIHPAIVVILLLFDFVFASFLHMHEAKVCEGKNAKFLLVHMEETPQYIENENEEGLDERHFELQNLLNNLSKIPKFRYLFQFLIIVVALIKIYLFYYLFGIPLNDFIGVGVMVTYLIVAYLHINHTGFFFAEIYTNTFIKKDKSKFDKTGSGLENLFLIRQKREYYFEWDRKLKEFNLELPNRATHELVKVKDLENDKGFGYMFKSYGVLTDTELQTFISKQVRASEKICVAVNGLRHQMEILNSEPLGAEAR